MARRAARVLSLAFNEARDAIFINVAQRAIRTVALEVFRHLHALSMRFHLGRQTGRLSLAIERGARAIESLLRFIGDGTASGSSSPNTQNHQAYVTAPHQTGGDTAERTAFGAVPSVRRASVTVA